MKNQNHFFYYLREGFRGFTMHGFMSFAAVCIIVACLIIMGTFAMLLVNVSAMLEHYEQECEILVYIDENYPTAEAHSVGSKINRVGNVREAIFVTREEALENFKNQYADSTKFDGLDAQTFRDRFQVYLEDLSQLEQTEAALQAIDGVAEVNSNPEVAQGFTTLRNILSWVSMIIVGILLIVSLFIISNTIRLALMSRREEIGIMRMVGATNGFIRGPFVIEGLILGLMGSVLSFFLLWGLYEFLRSRIATMDVLQMMTLLSFENMAGIMASACLGAGILIGVLGSLLSIHRFLRV